MDGRNAICRKLAKVAKCVAKANKEGNFPDGPVVNSLSFHCRGKGSNPGHVGGKKMERRRVGGKEAREKAWREKRREEEKRGRAEETEGKGWKKAEGWPRSGMMTWGQ